MCAAIFIIRILIDWGYTRIPPPITPFSAWLYISTPPLYRHTGAGGSTFLSRISQASGAGSPEVALPPEPSLSGPEGGCSDLLIVGFTLGVGSGSQVQLSEPLAGRGEKKY